MKYAVVLCDGMADYPISALKDQTPMSVAKKPCMDFLSSKGQVGLVKTVPDGMKPGSDVANLSVMGYDPAQYYTGRSPLEAASIGIDLQDTDVTLRCNLVTLSEDHSYLDKMMVDYCADDISSQEAKILIEYIQEKLGSEIFHFYPGVSYRHCLVWKNGRPHPGTLTPPHDITGRKITQYIPNGPYVSELYKLMVQSYNLLKSHPVNLDRIKRGKRPANSIWLWGEGQRPRLDSFESKFHKKGSVVSAVDLIKGIGLCAKMSSVDVDGATGYIDTNFTGKMEAALQEFRKGQDFVYIHVEAPDECGHRGEMENKIKAIELIDEKILTPLTAALREAGPFRIMVLPDHPTPLSTKTHASDPVPYLIYDSAREQCSGVSCFCEETAKQTGNYVEAGPMLIEKLFSAIQA